MAISQDGKNLSPVYQLSDDYIEQLAANDPGLATALGIAGHDHEMTNFSPKGHAERDSINRAAMKTLDTLDTSNDRDRLAAGVLRNSLEMSCLEYDAGEHLRSIRVIAGDVDSARSIFDLMPTATVENWRTIAERMQAVPAAFAGMRESWGLGVKRGIVAPRRQALAVAEQLETWAGKRRGYSLHSFGDRSPVFRSGGWHQVEDASCRVDIAGDHPNRAQVFT
ncbi:MAG: DUF885 family protein, partial [Actinomycetota bacterium]